jgi:hypothetical protein
MPLVRRRLRYRAGRELLLHATSGRVTRRPAGPDRMRVTSARLNARDRGKGGCCDTASMGVDAVLRVGGEPVVGIPDPTGGTFDAAGDFDRLLPLNPDAFPILSRIDPEGVAEFGPSEMAAIVDEAERALASVEAGPERRGVLRLQALAAHGSGIPLAALRIAGD